MPNEKPGYELPLLLFGGFRALIDELHAQLRDQGHADLRPVHGFAMQAIGADGATASEVGRRLGVSKQAAGKTIDQLERLGYVARSIDERDSRRKDRKSTRLNSSHVAISYAVFCLKKKKSTPPTSLRYKHNHH